MIPKFRVWDKKRAEMLKLVSMNFHEHIPIDDLICQCSDGPITRNFEDVIIMQSTGLHDKNGVEIYEGDIVELADDFAVVKFDSGAFVIDYQNLDTEFELIYSIEVPIEVIGNIYENHELLEAAK
ncbi:YopX family protein [Lactococcus hircilactis]|uniref:YopX family protein n=1 Tax=Lactococcus hircilactis TaxID=1494462 RepID=UPI003FA23876